MGAHTLMLCPNRGCRYDNVSLYVCDNVCKGALPQDPLIGDDPAVALACRGWERATTGGWAPALDHALRATSQMAQILKGFATSDSLWSRVGETRHDI